MPLSELVVEIAVRNANKFNPDTSLMDAIVEMDTNTLKYLVDRVYRNDIIGKPYVSEKLNMNKMVMLLENKLNSKRINVLM